MLRASEALRVTQKLAYISIHGSEDEAPRTLIKSLAIDGLKKDVGKHARAEYNPSIPSLSMAMMRHGIILAYQARTEAVPQAAPASDIALIVALNH